VTYVFISVGCTIQGNKTILKVGKRWKLKKGACHPLLTITRVSNYTDSLHRTLKHWQLVYFTSLVYSLITPDSSVNKTNAGNTGVKPCTSQ
jgi:hypothetical protein